MLQIDCRNVWDLFGGTVCAKPIKILFSQMVLKPSTLSRFLKL